MSWKDPKTRRDIVYVLLQCIPPGFTVTYSLLAKLVGTTPRAVGVYMRANKDLIVVPCHRVVASKGLGGYSKGVNFKRKLLELEGAFRENGRLQVIRTEYEFWHVLEREGVVCCEIDT